MSQQPKRTFSWVRRLLLVALLAGLSVACARSLPRLDEGGMYFWAGSGSRTFDNVNVVKPSNYFKKWITILAFRILRVSRVYGAYQERPDTHPQLIADWNSLLNDAGIESFYLMSEHTWVCDSKQLRAKMQRNFIDFNNALGRTPEERFDGLHFDIEPHKLNQPGDCADWDKPDDRQKMLGALADIFRRAQLELKQLGSTHGTPNALLTATIPVSYKDPSYWPDDPTREAWYQRLKRYLDGISIMTFCRTSSQRVLDAISFERRRFNKPNEFRVVLNVSNQQHLCRSTDPPSCKCWTKGLDECLENCWEDVGAMLDVASDIAYDPNAPTTVDIQSFSRLMEEVGF